MVVPPGAVTVDVSLQPLDDAVFEGDETVILTLLDGDDYTAGSPASATILLRDDEFAPAPVLFMDDFENDSSADWITRFGANNRITDYTSTFAYDYLNAAIPLAPHSAPGGRQRSVRGREQNQQHDPRFRRRRHLSRPTARSQVTSPCGSTYTLSFGTAGTTEHALAGINHSTLLTNRVSQSTDLNNTTVGGDGVWVAIVTDASGNRDYTAYTTTNQANVPSIVASRTAGPIAPFPSLPRPTPSPVHRAWDRPAEKQWSSVELIQISNVVTLRVNAATVFSFTNNTGFESGAVMLGMNDQFDSVGSVENFVIFDNVEVINLSQANSSITITSIRFVGINQVEVDFVSPGGGVAEDFHLQRTDSLSPISWHDDPSASIVATGNGFRATATRSIGDRFYRIRR